MRPDRSKRLTNFLHHDLIPLHAPTQWYISYSSPFSRLELNFGGEYYRARSWRGNMLDVYLDLVRTMLGLLSQYHTFSNPSVDQSSRGLSITVPGTRNFPVYHRLRYRAQTQIANALNSIFRGRYDPEVSSCLRDDGRGRRSVWPSRTLFSRNVQRGVEI